MRRGLRDLLWFLCFLVLAALVAVPLIKSVRDHETRTVADDTPEDITSAPLETEGGVLPLLGTLGEVPRRPALAVKIDNTGPARPQVGLGQADVVFEEVVEGGLTRLLALFHSQDPTRVGPVRSARSTDILLLSEVGRPLFAWSGANSTFAAAVRAAAVTDVGFDALPSAYQRDPDRRAPVNLFGDPVALRAATPADSTTPPPTLFTYRPQGQPPAASSMQPASHLEAGGSGLTTRFAWDWNGSAGVWMRSQAGTPHVVEPGGQISAANVVVRLTPYHNTGLVDARGTPVPEADVVGEGAAWVLTGGHVIEGTWRKPSADARTEYVDSAGAPIALAPGNTWVEVLPPGSASYR